MEPQLCKRRLDSKMNECRTCAKWEPITDQTGTCEPMRCICAGREDISPYTGADEGCRYHDPDGEGPDNETTDHGLQAVRLLRKRS